MFGVHVVWQQRIDNVNSKIFPAESGIQLLLRSNNLINPGIESISIRWNRNQGLVVDSPKSGGQVRQRIVLIQQCRSKRTDIRYGEVRIWLTRRWISQHRIAGCSAGKGRRELAQISRPFKRSWNRILLRLRGPSPVALVVDEEERFVMAVIEMWNQ